MTDLLSLAARCEAAEGAGQFNLLLDAFEAVKGARYTWTTTGFRWHDDWFAFEKKLNAFAYESAAMTLVPEGWGYIDFRRFDDGTVGCDMEVIGIVVDTIEACAATPALALCAASLRALAAMDKPHD